MNVDYLIIGQGISGTWLSYYLEKEDKQFIVIDNNNKNAPSRIAAGVINPVTGRRHATVWMAEEIIPFAWEAYSTAGKELNITAISHKNIIDFFPSPQMLLSFKERIEENNHYLHSYPEQNQFNPYFNYDFGCGEVRPSYIVHLEIFLPAWRNHLFDTGRLLEEEFEIGLLTATSDGIKYKDIHAKKIIFCDGTAGSANPYFHLLPFAPNKGEALFVEIKDLPAQHVYKQSMLLVPLAEENMWWVGSNYEWEFNSEGPSQVFRERALSLLQGWLKLPFTLQDHVAAVRPATLERRPFIGLHPLHPNICIMNGMGTKGCSLAPFFAKQLTDHLLYDTGINADADVRRFSGVLTRH